MDENETIEICEECGVRIAPGDRIHFRDPRTGSRDICMTCASAALTRWVDELVASSELGPQVIRGADGRLHRFQFSTDVHDAGLTVYACEPELERGYECEVLSGLDVDPIALLRDLYARIRRELSRRHLEVEAGALQICREGVVRGLIDALDPFGSEARPIVIIDGRVVKWDAFGRMLQQFMGWQFKLEVYELGEEIWDETLDHSRFLVSRTRGRKRLH